MFGDNNSQLSQHTQNNPGLQSSAAQPVTDNSLDGSIVRDDNADNFSSGAPAINDNHAASSAVPKDDLLNIKQEALQSLSPLVKHLEQTPEEKFRTTMMMIQASDDQSLVKTAYEIAKQITDEKARAQALLDVVNEINYFTQHNKN